MKARIIYVAPEVNSGKIAKLEELHTAYKFYVQQCIDRMIVDKTPSVPLSKLSSYFKASETLSSQITTCAQRHAVSVVEVWLKCLYVARFRKVIRLEADLTNLQKMELRCCGKYLIKKAGKFGKGNISQEMADLFWSWAWNPDISGSPPQVSDSFPMWMSELTCIFGQSKKSSAFGWWISVSCLDLGKRVKIPLSFNPYLKDMASFAKSVLVSKRNGRWSFQFVDNCLEENPDGSKGKVGIDVGLNVIAATSDGRIYGKEFKDKFDHTYRIANSIRGNRHRQGLNTDSKRLARLESKLSGMTKTITGTVSNKLVKAYPGFTFVMEDLDLRGCKGQKRFAYRALYNSLSNKAIVESVNPAYSSQMCPSCGYINKGNRNGTKFHCHCCGRISHADVIGGINLLGRSGDKQINSEDDLLVVKTILRERFRLRRTSSLDRKQELLSNSQGLTTKVCLNGQVGTASNQVVDLLEFDPCRAAKVLSHLANPKVGPVRRMGSYNHDGLIWSGTGHVIH